MIFKSINKSSFAWKSGLPYAAQFDDIYFSATDGLLEAMHVYIDGNDLKSRFSQMRETDVFVVGELGFGTGLNCLLTWQCFLQNAPEKSRLVIFSTEKYPLNPMELKQCYRLWPQLSREAELLLDAYPVLTPGLHSLLFEDGRVKLNLMLGDAKESLESLIVCGDHSLENRLRPWQVDAWFLDGFSPKKNPALWALSLLKIVALLSHDGTTFGTFSVAAMVKQHLTQVGFSIKKVAGFGKKRHCLQGVFRSETDEQFPEVSFKTPWFVAVPSKRSLRHAIVVGAGLSGCFVAHALSQRGWQITLLEANAQVGSGASANHQAILFPNLSAYRSPLTTWMLYAFLFAERTYRKWLNNNQIQGELNGILQFDACQNPLKAWLAAYPELGQLVDSQAATRLAGIPIHTEALYVPKAGWIDSQTLCQFLMQQPNISWFPQTKILDLKHDGDSWYVDGAIAPVVVLATGYQTLFFKETQALPLSALSGQMTVIKNNQHSEKLKIPLCGSGHIAPCSPHGTHWLGATYHPDSVLFDESKSDDKMNLDKLSALPVDSVWSYQVVDHWMGVRAKTPDYLPLVGPVPITTAFKERFAALSKDANRYIAMPGVYYPGLYVCAGFGSRGLTSIPLAAEYLATVITGDPVCLPQSIAKTISAARFLIKSIQQGKR